MTLKLSLCNGEIMNKQSVYEVMKCNDLTVDFGLVLTEQQALSLVETRSYALQENGRVEFGGGMIDKMINEFCDSPYLSSYNYEEVLQDLLEIFYYYKNETMDLIGDEDLIQYMKKAFDGSCQGSLELLSDREMYKLARDLRFGNAWNDAEEDDIEGDLDGEDGYDGY